MDKLVKRKGGQVKRVEIKITGIVQGVGFRPFIYQTAEKFFLKGYISNISSGIIIEFEGKEEDISKAIEYIKTAKPSSTVIETICVKEKQSVNYSDFKINESLREDNKDISISPDMGICQECQNELQSPKSRFYNYPFISCSSCGPRFTILEDIPYDRFKTSMKDFPMCDECKKEYYNPTNRRYHAQTICCSKCGPKLWALNYNDDVLDFAVNKLSQGKILAIKGIGGYHLVCDAKSDYAVNTLRQKKNRQDKPFAVMMDINKIEKECYLSELEKNNLLSFACPIVLLKQKNSSSISKMVNPNTDILGVMLPYSGIHKSLIKNIDALVMTSGNVSNEPIITDENCAQEKLSDIADLIIHHNRRITIGCDDSVVKCFDNNKIIIRRSRGFAPSSIKLGINGPNILACGGDLKNTFGIFKNEKFYMSQYIGDLQNKETFDWYVQNIDMLKKLLEVEFEYIICDYHPLYQSTIYAQSTGIQCLKAQHHHAHIASVMGEHNIFDQVIGISFDGTGYGDDGTLWGGEFLVATRGDYKREYHFENISMPGGETAVKEPWRMAMSYLYNTFGYFPDIGFVNKLQIEKDNFIKLINNKNLSPKTSSVGRFFDAVSSLIGLRDTITYEGQAAIELESIIDIFEKGSYNYNLKDRDILTGPIIEGIVQDIKNGLDKGMISAKFHNTLSEMALDICKEIRKLYQVDKVVLSGGVFQNINLLKSCINKLTQHGFKVYYNNITPINDGGIALGQIVIGFEKSKLIH